ncbi:leucine-rich repeat domain-containing protein [Methylocaldum gracile]|uniref:leucine-rich repeat domain-containing protein n=1 Tax=Methylocaldum sp. 0917 TaxID=2485163 RepID=UPI001414CD46
MSKNNIQDVWPLASLQTLTKLNLSGNSTLAIWQVRPVIDMNRGLTSLGLNGVEIGSFNNLGPLINWETGEPYALTELDLGNTYLTDPNGGHSLDFLMPFGSTLTRLNVAGNGINNIQVLGSWNWNLNSPNFSQLRELDLSNNALIEVVPLTSLHNLTKLNLSGNRRVALMQVRPVIDMSWELTSLGLNGIEIGSFDNLGPLTNPHTGQPYALAELDLGNTHLTDLNGGHSLDFLMPFAGTLTRLNVAGNGIDNIQVFASWGSNGPNFNQLKELDLSNNALVDVWPLSPLHNLTKLNLSGNPNLAIWQVRPVIDMNQGLTSLGLNGIEIGSFDNLGPLTNWETGQPYALQELDVGNTHLTDLNGGHSLDFLMPFGSTLTRLNVAGNGIDSIHVLGSWGSSYNPNFMQLRELDLSNNALIDVAPLSALHQLTKLNLSGNQSLAIWQVRPVLDMNRGLTSLGLNGIEIGSFDNLGPLINWETGKPYALAELDLGNTHLTDPNGGKSLDFLMPFGSTLTRLNVAGNGINNIQVFASWGPNGPNFVQLKELDLSSNALVDVWPLGPLHNLTKLNLSGNPNLAIWQVRPVIDMNRGLTSLGLNGIEIGSFDNLGPLTNWETGKPYALTELDLGNTHLTDLNGGKSLDFLMPFGSTLTRLNVAGNGIDNIQVFASWGPNGPNFMQLKELDLSNNALVDVWPLGPLHQLTKLNLSGNQSLAIWQVRPVLDMNRGLTSLGLNGIEIGSFSNLGPLTNWETGKPYPLVELDLGNTHLTDSNGGKSLDFLMPFGSTLTRLNVAGNGIDNIQVFASPGPNGPNFSQLKELDLSSNALIDVWPLSPLHQLTKLNLSGNQSLAIWQVRPVIDMNRGLTSLGLNGIEIGSFSNLGPLTNWETGKPYALTELDLGNTHLTDLNGGKSLDFLMPFGSTLTRLNVAGNDIDNIQVFASWGSNGPNFSQLKELDLSSNALVDVWPLTQLHALGYLNLVSNDQIGCNDLDMLVAALPSTLIQRPTICQ